MLLCLLIIAVTPFPDVVAIFNADPMLQAYGRGIVIYWFIKCLWALLLNTIYYFFK